ARCRPRIMQRGYLHLAAALVVLAALGATVLWLGLGAGGGSSPPALPAASGDKPAATTPKRRPATLSIARRGHPVVWLKLGHRATLRTRPDGVRRPRPARALGRRADDHAAEREARVDPPRSPRPALGRHALRDRGRPLGL